jgi:hypothetical protein
MSYWDNLSHAARQIIPLDRPTYEIIGPFSIFGDFQQGMRFALVTGREPQAPASASSELQAHGFMTARSAWWVLLCSCLGMRRLNVSSMLHRTRTKVARNIRRRSLS